MNDFDTLKTQFENRFSALQSIMAGTLKQVFQQESDVIIEHAVSDNQNLVELISGEGFPRVLVLFDTKSNENNQHIVSLDTVATAQLYAWMIGAEPVETVGDEQIEGLQEAANQIIGQITASTEEDNKFSVDGLKIVLVNNADESPVAIPDNNGLAATYSIKFGESAFSLVHCFWNTAQESAEENESTEESEGVTDSKNINDKENSEGDEVIDEVLGTDDVDSSDKEKTDVAPAEFDNFGTPGNVNEKTRNINMLLDVELEVQVELGKKLMKIQDVLKLGKGSVLELEKTAGEPLEMFVNNRKLAEGEVVVIDDYFGIRITKLVSPRERISNLG